MAHSWSDHEASCWPRKLFVYFETELLFIYGTLREPVKNEAAGGGLKSQREVPPEGR